MGKSLRVAYGEALVKLGAKNDKVVVLDADLAHATQTCMFKDVYPDRHFNMGIAEANMMCAAAGFAHTGYVPFVSTFALFGAGRAFEQIRNSICYTNCNVKFGFSHSGLCVGEDGGSHQAIEDLALMRVIPGMTVVVPCDASETRRAVLALADMQGPAYLRLARLPSPVFEEEMPFEIGKANVLRDGNGVAVFACGIMVNTALECAKKLEAEGVSVAVINMHTIKPIDRDCILKYAAKCGKIVTVEEHSVIGGLGDAVGSVLLENGCPVKFCKIGVQDRFGQSGKPADLLEEYGLSEGQVYRQIKEMTE